MLAQSLPAFMSMQMPYIGKILWIHRSAKIFAVRLLNPSVVCFRSDTTSAKICTDKLHQLNRHALALECSELYQRTVTIFSCDLLFKIKFSQENPCVYWCWIAWSPFACVLQCGPWQIAGMAAGSAEHMFACMIAKLHVDKAGLLKDVFSLGKNLELLLKHMLKCKITHNILFVHECLMRCQKGLYMDFVCWLSRTKSPSGTSRNWGWQAHRH